MSAWVTSADNRPAASRISPLFPNRLGNSVAEGEHLLYMRVKSRNLNAMMSRSKGRPPCHSRTSLLPSQPVQALPLAVTPLANKPLAAVPSALVQPSLQAAACFRVQPSVPAQTCLPASRVPYAATNLTDSAAAPGSASPYQNTDPAQPVLMRGFSVSSRPKRTAHVQ
jgi:hypothetical protein